MTNVDDVYLNLVDNLMKNGIVKNSRNGKIISHFGNSFTIDISNYFPILSIREIHFKSIIHELVMFLKGKTNSKEYLEEHGVTIWKGNTSKEFLSSVNLDYEEGEMGPMYGAVWRGNTENGVDQLNNVLNELIDNPNSRRLIFTSFNPTIVNKGVLYPCHGIAVQLSVNNGHLDLCTYQRSCDIYHGLPFNIASYALLLNIFCDLNNKQSENKLKPGKLNYFIGDLHLYENHIPFMEELKKREKRTSPTLNFNIPKNTNFDTIEANMFKLKDYHHSGKLSAPFNP